MLAMTVLVVLVVGAVLGAYAWLAPRRDRSVASPLPDLTMAPSTAWTHEAGDEFAELSEAARCDLIFAVAAFDDDRSQLLLQHALADPADAVATAAAHVLASTGRRDIVETYLAAHPGERARRIGDVLALLR